MRIMRYVALAIDWMIAIVVPGGILLFWLLATFFKYSPAVNFLSKFELTGWDCAGLVLGSIGVLVLNVLVVIDLVLKVCCPTYIRTETPAGMVSISIRAIQDALRRSVLAVDGVSSVRVSVSAPAKRGKPAIARAYVTLKGGISYRDVSAAIAGALEYKFADIVGSSIPLECRLYWEKIKTDASAAAAAPAPQYESVRPQFPVEDDESES